MKKVIVFIGIFSLVLSVSFAQDISVVFYNGMEFPEGVSLSSWGFTTNPMGLADGLGYTPGTPAIWWETSDWSWQGIQFDLPGPVDLSPIWNTDSLQYKLIAPSGINTLAIYLFDANGSYDNAVYMVLSDYDSYYDGTWKQYNLKLKDFVLYNSENTFDTSQVTAMSIEAAYENYTISEEMYFDDIWIGKPNIPIQMTLFNGRSIQQGVTFESWGFENNDLILAEDEGYTPGTPAIVWETSNWDWQGKGFIFNPHNFTYSWTVDTIKIKIKAPAGINDLALEWYDENYYTTYAIARKVLDDVAWDGGWKLLEIALKDFTVDENFDISKIIEFGIVAAGTTIPERILIDDIWTGNPVIDVVPPPSPANVRVTEDSEYPYMNFVIWDDIEAEHGETYDVYASLQPITDLNESGVFNIAMNVEEGVNLVAHHIYHPLTEGEISYYYAVTCTDGAGNKSVDFATMAESYTNVGKKRAIISLDAPQNFAADGNLSEWEHIIPFTLNPARNLCDGVFDDSLDYSAYCYVAMDNENLYVAFDVIDDVFSWREGNTVDWWNDESIEFFFGLYEFRQYHPYFFTGEEPDYRLVFLPNKILLGSGDSLEIDPTNYYFEPLGESDYIIEVKIPFNKIQSPGDRVFVPVSGMAIPFEIFAADADVIDGGSASRIQLGDNAARNPYHGGPKNWTFAWVGMPNLLDIDEGITNIVHTCYLSYNYPNPFNPNTTINYGITQSGNVELCVYNSLGQKVVSLVSQYQPAGNYTINFNAAGLSSGIYFYKISTQNFTQTKKMLFLK